MEPCETLMMPHENAFETQARTRHPRHALLDIPAPASSKMGRGVSAACCGHFDNPLCQFCQFWDLEKGILTIDIDDYGNKRLLLHWLAHDILQYCNGWCASVNGRSRTDRAQHGRTRASTKLIIVLVAIL